MTVPSGIEIGQELSSGLGVGNLRTLHLRSDMTALTGNVQASGLVVAYDSVETKADVVVGDTVEWNNASVTNQPQLIPYNPGGTGRGGLILRRKNVAGTLHAFAAGLVAVQNDDLTSFVKISSNDFAGTPAERGIMLAANTRISFSSDNTDATATLDAGIRRARAGVMRITDGALAMGGLEAATFQASGAMVAYVGLTAHQPLYQGSVGGAQRYVTSGELTAGAGGTPGTPRGSVQYNAGGAFAGDAPFVYDPPNVQLTVSGGTVSAASLKVQGQGYGFTQPYAGQLVHGLLAAGRLEIRSLTIPSGIEIGQELSSGLGVGNLRTLHLRSDMTTLTGNVQVSGATLLAYGNVGIRGEVAQYAPGALLVNDNVFPTLAQKREYTAIAVSADTQITLSGSFASFTALAVDGAATYYSPSPFGLSSLFTHTATYRPGAPTVAGTALYTLIDQPTLAMSGAPAIGNVGFTSTHSIIPDRAGSFLTIPAHTGAQFGLTISGSNGDPRATVLRTRRAIQINDVGGTGTVDAQFGVRVAALAKATRNWAFASDGPATPNYLAGSLLIGVSGTFVPQGSLVVVSGVRSSPPVVAGITGTTSALIHGQQGYAGAPVLTLESWSPGASANWTVMQGRARTVGAQGGVPFRLPTVSGYVYQLEARSVGRRIDASSTQAAVYVLRSAWLAQGYQMTQIGNTTADQAQSTIAGASAMFQPSGLSTSNAGLVFIASGVAGATVSWHTTMFLHTVSG